MRSVGQKRRRETRPSVFRRADGIIVRPLKIESFKTVEIRFLRAAREPAAGATGSGSRGFCLWIGKKTSPGWRVIKNRPGIELPPSLYGSLRVINETQFLLIEINIYICVCIYLKEDLRRNFILKDRPYKIIENYRMDLVEE